MKKIFKIGQLLVMISLICPSLLFGQDSKQPTKDLHIVGVGFAKCGTTVLFKELAKHDKIHLMYRQKYNYQTPEMNFWMESDVDHAIGQFTNKDLVAVMDNKDVQEYYPMQWYESLMQDEKLNIEKTPAYILHPEGMKALYEYNPNVKIIIQVRNPIDYLYSYYLHKIRSPRNAHRREYKKSFEEFLKDKTWKGIKHKETAKFINFIDGVYAIFPPENVYIIPIEDLALIKDFEQLCSLLDLPKPSENHELNFKVVHYKDKINPKLYADLVEYYKESNEELFDYIGRRIREWD